MYVHACENILTQTRISQLRSEEEIPNKFHGGTITIAGRGVPGITLS
ncbi:hypothetical protein ANCCEY_00275 [Ancylostoma ceylanicum]|uniref:Uncharacterized protein n=1 Tax=Ancylostoma ceylanicum TaxID=53326 RepID=A0A0D6MBQ6_9BILA|nr:hypothetical protein ANCCEY_00275 [Ancylostoma ceylanicum]